MSAMREVQLHLPQHAHTAHPDDLNTRGVVRSLGGFRTVNAASNPWLAVAGRRRCSPWPPTPRNLEHRHEPEARCSHVFCCPSVDWFGPCTKGVG